MNFRFSPKTRRNILRIVPFGIIWFLLGNIFLLVEMAVKGNSDAEAEARTATAITLDFQLYTFAVLAVFFVGLLVGTTEVLYLNRRFIHKSFIEKIIYKSLVYITLLFFIILIAFPIAASMEMNTNILDTAVWDRYWLFIKSKTYASTNLQLTVQLVISLLYFEISENIGRTVLNNFFTGKYHHPRQEKRIFMFLDMKSSTTIAEKLGHIQYFKFLKTYFDNLSDAIIQYEGEVYQYVGDEVIISWPLDKGIDASNCIHCFQSMKAALKRRSEFYLKTFGEEPSFKAGLHCGEVTTGEIGALKKEIIFTGDILNATARIQSLCNDYGVDLLLSEDLKDVLPTANFQLKSLGKQKLRGKSKDEELFTIP